MKTMHTFIDLGSREMQNLLVIDNLIELKVRLNSNLGHDFGSSTMICCLGIIF